MCTEAGMSAICAERDYIIQEDFMKVFCGKCYLGITIISQSTFVLITGMSTFSFLPNDCLAVEVSLIFY